jgi:hypothetical protein
MEPTAAADAGDRAHGPAPDAARFVDPSQIIVQPGDRLIASLWVATGLVVLRALLQSAVDLLKEGEGGSLLLEHFVDHLFKATGRAWIIVPALTILPRTRRPWTLALRGVVAAGISVVLLTGWPGGSRRYMPGVDTRWSLLGWSAIGIGSLVFVMFDRYATSPRRLFFQLSTPTRFMATALLLLVGGGTIATTHQVLEWRRRWMAVEGIVADLLKLFPDAKVDPGRGPPVCAASLTADVAEEPAGGTQPALVMGTGASVEYRLEVQANTSLTFGCAIDHASVLSGDDAPRQTIRFSVSIDGEERFDHEIRPQQVARDRRWHDQAIALEGFAGRTVTVRFTTSGSGPGVERAVVGFGRPLLVRTETLPRNSLNEPREPGDATAQKRMNLVVVVVDSLRADRLHCLGYPRDTTPAIDEIAGESVVYERARAPSSWTWPSVATLFTGKDPPSHGVVDYDRGFLSDSLVTLAEVLQANSFTTLGCTADPLVSHAKNFQQGFEVWREFPLATAERVEDEFGDWVLRYRDYQFFAYVEFVDPHRPFNPPQRFGEKFARAAAATAMRSAVNDLRARSGQGGVPQIAEEGVAPRIDGLALDDQDYSNLYDGEVAYVDDAIRQMRRQLEAAQLWARTLFVIVSDHGEFVGAVAPPAGASLDAAFVDVPLIVHDPRRPPSRVAEVVDTTFLVPTLLGMVEARPLAGTPPPLSLRPYGSIGDVAFSHTARGRLPGRDRECVLIGVENNDGRLVTTADFEVVDFTESHRSAEGDGERVRAALTNKLKRWYGPR